MSEAGDILEEFTVHELYTRVRNEIAQTFPPASSVSLRVVPNSVKSRDGRNFLARFISYEGRTKLYIELKQTALGLPQEELIDLFRHEFAHAATRITGRGGGHTQAWENVFRKFGGSGRRSKWCSD